MFLSYDLDCLIPAKPQRKANGMFTKGHIPHNKGKKWGEWMDGRKQRKVKKNLIHTGNPNIGGWNKKHIIASKDGKEYWFESATAAAKALNLIRRNICHVANGQRNLCGGWRFRYTENEQH